MLYIIASRAEAKSYDHADCFELLKRVNLLNIHLVADVISCDLRDG